MKLITFAARMQLWGKNYAKCIVRPTPLKRHHHSLPIKDSLLKWKTARHSSIAPLNTIKPKIFKSKTTASLWQKLTFKLSINRSSSLRFIGTRTTKDRKYWPHLNNLSTSQLFRLSRRSGAKDPTWRRKTWRLPWTSTIMLLKLSR